MACTTILVGKKASYDGSTMIARNDDSASGHFTAKKVVVVQPQEQPGGAEHKNQKQKQLPFTGTAVSDGKSRHGHPSCDPMI